MDIKPQSRSPRPCINQNLKNVRHKDQTNIHIIIVVEAIVENAATLRKVRDIVHAHVLVQTPAKEIIKYSNAYPSSHTNG